jgi:hypothetical protein
MSCSNEASLQQYYVDSENKSDILMVDIPTSLLIVKEDMPADARQALESVDKLNLLAFKLNKNNNAAFNEEKAKVKKILNNSSYRELLKINDRGVKIEVKYLGDDDSMNEVIVYASDNNKGFALGRLLGDDMKPENMLSLLESIKDMDSDSKTFKTIENYFK